MVQQLLAAGFAVTALTRNAQNASLPLGAQLAEVDYESLESLTQAFKGHDVVVSTLGPELLAVQHRLIDAAIAAGVPRFVPSEFGSDTANERARALPLYAPKVQTDDYLKSKAQEGALTYTTIRCGPFLDWCIMVGFFLNPRDCTIELADGGDRPFSTTTLDSTGKALANALKQPALSENRAFYVQDALLTQNQLLTLGRQLKQDKEWTVTHVDTAKLEQEARDSFSKGDYGFPAVIKFLRRAVFAEGFGGAFPKTDNEALQIEEMSEEQVKNVLARYI